MESASTSLDRLDRQGLDSSSTEPRQLDSSTARAQRITNGLEILWGKNPGGAGTRTFWHVLGSMLIFLRTTDTHRSQTNLLRPWSPTVKTERRGRGAGPRGRGLPFVGCAVCVAVGVSRLSFYHAGCEVFVYECVIRVSRVSPVSRVLRVFHVIPGSSGVFEPEVSANSDVHIHTTACPRQASITQSSCRSSRRLQLFG